MISQTFPLLCFNLSEKAVLGLLVGTNVQVVEPDVQKLKNTLKSYLLREYNDQGVFTSEEITNPQLRIIETPMLPTFRRNLSAFPMQDKINVPVAVVFGESKDSGSYSCYMPLLNESFQCHDLNKIEMLAQHFIQNNFINAAPDMLYKIANYPRPYLETIQLRVKAITTFLPDWEYNIPTETLERLAEQYPYPKNMQRNTSALPEAAWELDEYVAQVSEILFQQRASFLLVGDHGVGKSAILRQVFRKYTMADRRKEFDCTFWRIQAQRFTATSKYLGEWQDKVESLVDELYNIGGVLWVEDVARLLHEGGKGAEDSVAAYLLPFIQQRKLRLAGEVTPQQLESMRRRLPGFVESMQLVEIPELSDKKLNRVFENLVSHLQQNLKVQVTHDAVSVAVRLLRRYYPYESFPGKGIRFLGECVSDALFHQKQKVTRSDVVAHFIRRTGLPELFLRDDLLLDQEELHLFFNSRIIGQEAAVDKLCDVVKIFKAGLNNPHKPITTFIFAGPTGVGKTASAQALAEYFYGKGQHHSPLVRIDMSEFQHPSQITRFLGAGMQPGKLVSDVRERPFAVLLLDEAEKASPSIFDAFLTVLDEGMMVDAFGRVTNFRNCIIILTTNLGAANRRSLGYGQHGPDDEVYRSAISHHFRPEFVNRIDGIVVFQPLSQEHIRQIARKELAEATKREGFTKLDLKVHFSPNVEAYLTVIGFHEKYGARPLQRAMEDHIVRPLAKWLLRNPTVKGKILEVNFNGKIEVTIVSQKK